MFTLTRQERQVLLFLITIALCGMGINFLLKRYVSVKTIFCLESDFGKVNLNQADKAALLDLPGIAETLAERIIAYRKQAGGFKDPLELKNIKGFNENKYEKLKDLVIVK